MEENYYNEKVILPSEQSSLDIAENIIEKIRNKFNISKDNYFNILVAITEAINNAISHGNHYQINKKVRFEVTYMNELLDVVVQDEGGGFDPDELEDCTKEENLLKDSGRGIFIMQSLADKFEISTSNEGTCFRLVFKIPH
jgi:serine/threonine-protein kinase RsbW